MPLFKRGQNKPKPPKKLIIAGREFYTTENAAKVQGMSGTHLLRKRIELLDVIPSARFGDKKTSPYIFPVEKVEAYKRQLDRENERLLKALGLI